jgi:SCP-2 sterol transfer family
VVARYPFLSDEWFREVRRLHEAYDSAAPADAEIRMNLMITETPFGGDLPMHMAAAGGRADWGEGHLDDADVTLTLGYHTAKEIFVGGNPQAAIEAFMAGKIIMQGDISKLIEMQAAQPGPAGPELTKALQDITAEYEG